MEKEWCVYIHTNQINNKKYVGLTCNINKRFDKNGEGYLHVKKDGTYVQPAMANAINKYGWDNFSHEIVASNLTKEEADTLEKEYIKKYDTRNPLKGYNIREGGSNGHLSEQTKQKLSEIMKGKYDGENNPFYGKHHTQEVKELLRENGKNNARDISGKNNPMYNHMITDEERQKRSESMKGHKVSDDTKNKISKANKEYYQTHIHHALGTHKTEEQKEHMREKMIGREMNDEWKKKIGLGHAPYRYICVETQVVYETSGEAERDTGINRSSIRNVADGKAKTAGGFHWIKVKK